MVRRATLSHETADCVPIGLHPQHSQDYLVKGKIDGRLLVRSLRYAIERQRLLREFEESRQREQHECELRLLERAVAIPGSPATASIFGQVPLREAKQEAFGKLVQRYADLIDLALEQRTFKVEHDLSGQLRSLAESMRFLRAVPRDVAEVHSAALKSKTTASPSQKAQACREEAQFMLLEIIGDLSSFDRKYSTGIMTGVPSTSAAKTGHETTTILVVTTDGVQESMSLGKTLFGEQRIIDVVRANRNRSSQAIVQALYEATRKFAEGGRQADDIAAIVVKVLERS